jgi:hypothetical protein
MTEVWHAGGSIAIFLDAIDNNKQAQMVLAETLATSLLKNEKCEKPSFQFKVKCLAALIGLLEKSVFADILQGLGYENIESGNDLDNLMKKLVAGSA